MLTYNLLRGRMQPLNSLTSVDVLLICALKDEYEQAKNVTEGLSPTGWQECTQPNGWFIADGQFDTPSGRALTVRITWASGMGREQAQATASMLMQTNPARCIAMSGICAGRRGKVSLGDVIFADRLWSYDAGKVTQEAGSAVFQGDIQQYHPSPVWVQRMQAIALSMPPQSAWLSSRPDLSFEYQEDWVLLQLLAGVDPRQSPVFERDCPDWSDVLQRLWKREWVQKPLLLTDTGKERAVELALIYPKGLPAPEKFQIHVAPIATGASVTEDKDIFSRLSGSMRKVLGLDMEASALATLGDIHNIPVIIAKGVSDFGDSFKDDRYRNFAARASAECLLALLRNAAEFIQSSNTTELNEYKPEEKIVFNDLIIALAEAYPDIRDARTLWERAGGKGSELENNPRPRDMWQRIWGHSINGASVKPIYLIQEALKDLPGNAIFNKYLGVINTL